MCTPRSAIVRAAVALGLGGSCRSDAGQGRGNGAIATGKRGAGGTSSRVFWLSVPRESPMVIRNVPGAPAQPVA
jgi:hypothetical protein